MKAKYNLAIKFFTDTKNKDQLDICNVEIEKFLDNFSEFMFYIELDNLKLDPKIEAQLGVSSEILRSENFTRIFDDYRYRACENTFSGFNYNFELFKYALDKVFEEERKEQKDAEELDRIKNPSKYLSWYSKLYNKLTSFDKDSNMLPIWLGAIFLISVLALFMGNYASLFRK